MGTQTGYALLQKQRMILCRLPQMASCDETPYEDGRRWLECQICLSSMVGRKPRGLNCLHTFCETCLAQLPSVATSITCPICRAETKMPQDGVAGLPTNFMIEQLATSLQQVSLCHVCAESGVSHRAVFYCNDGCGRLCGACKASHDTVPSMHKHEVTSLDKTEEIRSKHCLAHNKVLDLFCTTCKTCICHICAISPKHRGHEGSVDEIKNEYQRLSSKIKDAAKLVHEVCTEKLSEIQTDEDGINNIIALIENEYQQRKQQLDGDREKLLRQVTEVSTPLNTFKSKLENIREGTGLITGRLQVAEIEKYPQLKMSEIMVDEGKCRDLQKEAGDLKKPYVSVPEFVVSSCNTELGSVKHGPPKVGDRVRVRKKIVKPKYDWGSAHVSHSSIGTVIEVTGQDCVINFPQFNTWKGDINEMEVVAD